jgi:hypothetical protein
MNECREEWVNSGSTDGWARAQGTQKTVRVPVSITHAPLMHRPRSANEHIDRASPSRSGSVLDPGEMIRDILE